MATIFSDPHVSSFGHRRESGWSGMIYPSVNSRFLFPIISCLCPKIESMRTCSSIQVGQPRVDCFVFLKMDVAFTFLQLLVLSPELHNLSKMIESSFERMLAIFSVSWMEPVGSQGFVWIKSLSSGPVFSLFNLPSM